MINPLQVLLLIVAIWPVSAALSFVVMFYLTLFEPGSRPFWKKEPNNFTEPAPGTIAMSLGPIGFLALVGVLCGACCYSFFLYFRARLRGT